mgnify:FL=1
MQDCSEKKKFNFFAKMCDITTIKGKEGETMKPTVKLFLALAEEQERPIHIALF